MRFTQFKQATNFLFYTLISVFCLFVTNTYAQQQIEPGSYVESLPAWVVERQVEVTSVISKSEISEGIYYRLLDKQINVKKNGDVSHYNRYVQTLTNQTALENSSQLNLDYDPSYQILKLHSLDIIRDGLRISRLNSARYSLLQREKELDKQIYDGSLTLNIIIEDMRKGDTLDYSYSLYGSNPVYNNIFSYQSNVSWSVPVHHQYIRVLWAKQKQLFINQKNINIDVEHKRTAEQHEYQVYLVNQPTVKYESEAPDWYDPYSVIYFSESQSWSEVVNWAQPMYRTALKEHPSIVAIADKIQNTSTQTTQQIAAALRYSQDEIRYLGIEMGVNSHLPTAAHETLELRYGDCKDKAVLFIAILKQLGIEAYPALVNTYSGQALNQSPAIIDSFNHVIVTFQLAGKRYWLDPTLSYQKGKLSALFQPDYGYALIIKKDETQLTSMRQDKQNSFFEILEHYQIQDENSARLTAQTNYFGNMAQAKHAHIERDGLQRISESFMHFYQYDNPSLILHEEMKTSFDANTGRLSFIENYQITNFWTKDEDGYEMYFYAYDIRDALYKPKVINRTSPMKLQYPYNISHQITIDFFRDKWNFDNNEFIEDNDYFYFKSTTKFKGKQLILSYDYSSKKDHVPSNAIKAYLTARDKVYNVASFGIVKYSDNPIADQTDSVTTEQDFFTEDEIVTVIFIVYLIACIYIIISWRRESARRPAFPEVHFFPVSLSKFLIMSIFTLGFFTSYWCYRNWQFIKQQGGTKILSIWRGIFALFWYYPLYLNFRKDSETRYQTNKVMLKCTAIALAIMYFPLVMNDIDSKYMLITITLTALLYLPLVNYTNYANDDSNAYQYNSKWRRHNILVILLVIPFFAVSIAQQIHFLPNSAVVSGENILQRDLQYLQRKQVIPANEEIVYFYSDALWSVRDDGNGFTQQRIFSYWKNEQGILEKQIALFTDVENVEPTFAKNDLENTLVTITRKDGSTFILFVSAKGKQDKIFFDALKTQWEASAT